VLRDLEGVNRVYMMVKSKEMGVGMAIYLRESLQSPKWLIPKVAQPQHLAQMKH